METSSAEIGRQATHNGERIAVVETKVDLLTTMVKEQGIKIDSLVESRAGFEAKKGLLETGSKYIIWLLAGFFGALGGSYDKIAHFFYAQPH